MGRLSTWGHEDGWYVLALPGHSSSAMRPVERVPAAIESFPVRIRQTLSGRCPILAIAAHSDDEMLSSGGLIVLTRAAERPTDVDMGMNADRAACDVGSIASPPGRLSTPRVREMRSAVSVPAIRARRPQSPGLRGSDPASGGTVARRVVKRLTRRAPWRRTNVVSSAGRHDPQRNDHPTLRPCTAAGARLSAGPGADPSGQRSRSSARRTFGRIVIRFRVDPKAVLAMKRAAITAERIGTRLVSGRADRFVLGVDLLQKLCFRHKAYLQCV
jgi:hypothetical protein